jgi:hypothetical protein
VCHDDHHEPETRRRPLGRRQRGEVREPVRETEDRVPVVTAYQPMTLL